MDTILVVNAGSSSVKFQVFGIEGGRPQRQIKGKMEGIGTRPRLPPNGAEGKSLVDANYDNEAVPDVPAALHAAGGWLRDERRIHPIAVGHRVVHGGPDFDRPVLVKEEVLAPPRTLYPARAAAPAAQSGADPVDYGEPPGSAQVACFDTAFHREPRRASPITMRSLSIFYAEGVRRYGFHGLSYEYIAAACRRLRPTSRRKESSSPIWAAAPPCAR